MILAIWPLNGSLYALPVLILNLLILYQHQLKFFTHHCTAGLLKINYYWTFLIIFGKAWWEIFLVVTFFLIVSCSKVVPGIWKMGNLR